MAAEDRKLSQGTALASPAYSDKRYVVPAGGSPPWAYETRGQAAGYISFGGTLYPIGTLTSPQVLIFSGGTVVSTASPVLSAPTIADFTNATHDHTSNAEGGTVIASHVVQVVHTQTGTYASLGTTTIPLDDTIPTSSEGNAATALDTAITPTSATNKLLIEVTFIGSNSGGHTYVCLFQDAGSAAIAVAGVLQGAGNELETISFKYVMVAGTTSATTFKIRAGSNNAGTQYLNGRSGAQVFGGVLASSITITEILV